MKNLYIILSLLFILILPETSYAQFPVEEEDEYYEKEWALGVMMNTYGGVIGGITIRHARKYFYEHKIVESLGQGSGKTRSSRGRVGEIENDNKYHSFSLEFLSIKHPKEQKVQSYTTGEGYVSGKMNRLYAIRPMFGKEWLVFRKARKQGVHVNFIASVGPSIGIVSPYLLKYQDDEGNTQTKQFSQDDYLNNYTRIEGTASWGESMSKASVIGGLAFKASLTFEFGVNKRSITGIEAGIIGDAYTSEVQIMASSDNRSFYSAMFLTFFFGGRK
ncbi:hypothetical protein EI427_15675 [Flammeovirga pectinis]|uniref:Outer membrane protein beta-barrel domain-containing protein n=1 Tax=Flammeovirga pectinis TaxID=2494373 RepID=A0A3Q9FSP7_9BACT|nr:hypothetical protein [Flammeovirga pectinis]AZQ63610.1 hypothetical protein EI427_15675 [Flammeovirga pectinis]